MNGISDNLSLTSENREKFNDIQWKLWKWQEENFGPTSSSAPPRHPFLGMCEESGELVHSILKLSQGIRGTREEHIAHIKDAIGDIMVYLINFFYRSDIGFVQSKDSYFRKFGEQKSHSKIQLEMLSWSIFKDVTHLGLYFEPAFTEDFRLPVQYHNSIKETVEILCDDLVYLCNLLGFTLYECIEEVWVNVLSKRNWKSNPVNGVA